MTIASLLKALSRKSLSLFCLLLLVGFHTVNWAAGQSLKPVKQWWSQLGSARIALSRNSKDTFSFPFPAVVEPKPKPTKRGKKPKDERPKLEPAVQWLSWTGIFLRTLVNQSQPRWINYPRKGKRYYYLRDEFAFQYRRQRKVAENAFVQITREVNKVVTDAGATLVVVPMPTKVSMYRNRLSSWLPEQDLWTPVEPYDKTEDPYEVYSATQLGAPRETVDVFSAFSRYRQQHPQDDLYIPHNHQWSSLGIAVTAAAVVSNLRSRGWPLAKPKVVPLKDEGELYEAELIQLLNLPEPFARFYAQTQLREPKYGLSAASTEPSSGRLFIFGTCYSFRMLKTNGFANVLGRALGRSNIINLSADGGDTIPSFVRFRRKYKHFNPGDLVIWEFLERSTFSKKQLWRIRQSLGLAKPRRPHAKRHHGSKH